MLRKISLVTALLFSIVYANGQGMNFGVHVDPLLSFMGSNDRDVIPNGMNLGFAFGVEGEYYLNEDENYAITFGGNFALNKGGKLQYEDGGYLFPRTELDDEEYFFLSQSANTLNVSGDSITLVAGTTVSYNINYVEIPLGFKLRTNELGGSYMRAFFHIPVATIGIPVSARATIDAPDPGATVYRGFYTNDGGVKGENIYSEIVPLQFSLGVGAGVEYSPNEEGGLRLVGGVYYSYGFLDTVKKNETFEDPSNPFTGLEENSARSGFHNVGIRIGIVF